MQETTGQLIINKITTAQVQTMTLNDGELYLAPDTTTQDIADAVSTHNSSSSAHSGTFAAASHTHTKSQITDFPTIPIITNTYSGTSTDGMSGKAVKSAIDAAISSVYKPAGSIAFASRPTLSSSILGNVYNVTDAFTTTSDFVEGAGSSYPAGTNIGVVDVGTASSPSYKFDVFAGFVDLSGYQTLLGSSNKLSADYIQDGSTNKVVTQTEKNTWSGKQNAITSSSKLSADLISDGSTNKTVTQTEKNTWNGKQNSISDLSTIRSGAAAGATAVQPGDLATVATTGNYNDLLNKPENPQIWVGTTSQYETAWSAGQLNDILCVVTDDN